MSSKRLLTPRRLRRPVNDLGSFQETMLWTLRRFARMPISPKYLVPPLPASNRHSLKLKDESKMLRPASADRAFKIVCATALLSALHCSVYDESMLDGVAVGATTTSSGGTSGGIAGATMIGSGAATGGVSGTSSGGSGGSGVTGGTGGKGGADGAERDASSGSGGVSGSGGSGGAAGADAAGGSDGTAGFGGAGGGTGGSAGGGGTAGTSDGGTTGGAPGTGGASGSGGLVTMGGSAGTGGTGGVVGTSGASGSGGSGTTGGAAGTGGTGGKGGTDAGVDAGPDGGSGTTGGAAGTGGTGGSVDAGRDGGPGPTGGGDTLIIAGHSGKCMTVEDNGTAEGTNIEQRTCTGSSGQVYRFQDQGGSVYKILHVASGRYVSANGPATNNYVVELRNPSTSSLQQFNVVHDMGGYSNLINRAEGYCIDIYLQQTSEGAPYETHECNGNAHQAFRWASP